MALWWRLIRPWSQNVMGLLAVCPCQCYLAFLYLRTILAITNLSAKYGLSCALPFQTRWSLFLASGTALCLKHILSPSPRPAASLLSVHLAHTLRSVVHPPPMTSVTSTPTSWLPRGSSLTVSGLSPWDSLCVCKLIVNKDLLFHLTIYILDVVYIST